MDVSVSGFQEHCLELLRQVESSGEDVEITRDGKPVARLTPVAPGKAGQQRPWESLRGTGVLVVEPEETMLETIAFNALQ